ncbi:MAG: hypothetical protein V1775_14525 [Bacteroidota bacterium]
MEKLNLKKQITDICRNIKQESEANLIAAIKDAEQSANEYGQPKDRYDSYRAQLSNKRDMLAQQLHKIQEEIGLIDRIDLSRECDTAGFGAIVITPVQKVFISIGIGKIKVDDGAEFYAISAAVPFARAIRDLKKGDVFEFNGRKLEILDLF